ncbi:two-component sensor histidine kinase [Clavibacter michiganensis]|uniref:sensor histidine kinase n=1 Tax=Clavibacter michiganensis TaxID=28447 RepID=UPI000CE85888|nr:histidine kinase [Clavibacter michiganensis]PPF51479.1 two-component sensor histidine kinase [Clavibacter michiganensis]
MPRTGRSVGRARRRGSVRGRPVPPADAAGLAVLAVLAAFDLLVVDLRWPALAFAAVAVLAVLAHRHRVPARVAVAASLFLTAVLAVIRPDSVGSFGLVELAALLILLITVVREADGSRREWAAVAVAAAVLALPARVPSPDAVVYVIVLALAVVSCIAVGGSLRTGDRAAEDRVEVARRGEREAIARELHDVVAHHVTGIVVVAQAGRATSPLDAERAGRMLADIEGAGERALEAMQQLVGVLRADGGGSAPVAPVATLADLPALVERFRAAVHTVVDARLPDPANPAVLAMTDEMQASVYRIVQESLTNVRRHAPAARTVLVDVALADGRVRVEVRDDGGDAVGGGSGESDRDLGGGFGVIGMTERARALGGTLDAGPDGAGWSVRADLPAGRP